MERKCWSVTTLINAGLPKEALVHWAARATGEYALDNLEMLETLVKLGNRHEALELLKRSRYDNTRKAQKRGTTLHSFLERLSYGETPEPPEGLEPYAEQIRRFLADHAPIVHAAESPVYSVEHGYAGTLDLILELPAHPGRLLVTDMKTTDKGPGESRPPYPEVALQLAAYRHAQYIGLPGSEQQRYEGGRRYYVFDDGAPLTPMPPTAAVGLALIVSPSDYVLVPVRVDDTVLAAFLDVRNVANWTIHTSRRVLGPPIIPARAPTPA